MSKYRFKLNLQLFADDGAVADAGVESAPVAEVQTGGTEVEAASQTGVEGQAAAEPEKQNNFEKAFAKRLAQEREKWEAERARELEKYKDYDTYRDIAEYFREATQMQDLLSLKEAIELERLQRRAEKENVPPEVLKRIDELEAKAKQAEEMQRQQEEARQYQEFRSKLEAFAKEKGIDPDKLHQFMYDNQIGNFEAAYKAMKHDELLQQLENAKKEGVKEFLEAKGSIPKVEGATKTGAVMPGTPKTFAEARERALQRFGG